MLSRWWAETETNGFVLKLDASKAFDSVRYCKLFNELLKCLH